MALSRRKARIRKAHDPKHLKQQLRSAHKRLDDLKLRDAIQRLSTTQQLLDVQQLIEHIQASLAKRLQGYVSNPAINVLADLAINILNGT